MLCSFSFGVTRIALALAIAGTMAFAAPTSSNAQTGQPTKGQRLGPLDQMRAQIN